jgi:hypothetical protein
MEYGVWSMEYGVRSTKYEVLLYRGKIKQT